MKNKTKIVYNAPVTLSFVIACFIVTLIGILSSGKITQLLFATYHSSLKNPLTYVRLLTHVLGHSDIGHFVGNASYLLLLGPMLEEKYGKSTMLQTIMITAVLTGLVNYVFFPNIMLCGASGIVFSFIILSSFTNYKKKEIPLTFILVAVFFIGQQIYEGITIQDNISNMSHIIGGIIGAFMGYEINRKSAST